MTEPAQFKKPVDPASISYPPPAPRTDLGIVDQSRDVPTWAVIVAAVCVLLGLVVLLIELFPST